MSVAPAQRPRTTARPATSARAAVSVRSEGFAFLNVMIVALVLVLVHVYCINRFGFFRDELYYVACAKRMDWGFVDQPPLSIFLLKLVAGPLGYPLWLVRVPAIACGALSCFVAALTARALGGKVFAQTLASIAIAVTPTILVTTHMYSMNSVDILLWSVAAWIWATMQSKPADWRWLAIGLVIGVACLNKLSALWLLGGLAFATVLTPKRGDLKTAFPWVGFLLVGAGLAPYVSWQVEHQWVTLDFMKNAYETKLLALQPWMYLAREAVVINPLSFPLWVVGLVAAFINPKWRGMALVFATVLGLMLVSGKARENYLTPAYFFVFAPGAVTFENWLPKAKAILVGYAGVLGLSGFAVSVLALPLLQPSQTEFMIHEARTMSGAQIPSSEKGIKNDLQGMADMNGWPEMARAVDEVYMSLPESERKNAIVFTHNYGEAAGIEYFTKIPGLKVTGQHNNYWLWGSGNWDGKVAILVGEVPPTVTVAFKSYEPVRKLNSRFASPEEATAQIAIGRDLKMPVSTFWASSRRID